MAAKCKLTVSAGEHARGLCPVSVDLDWDYKDAKAVELRDETTKKPIPCQVEKARAGVTLTWLTGKLKAGETQKLIAQGLPKAQETAPAVSLVDNKNDCRVDVDILGKPFTAYHYGQEWVRPFLFPVLGPDETQVTRSYPMREVKGEKQDHHHHKSIWVAYGECDRVDNWSEEKGHGYQRHQAFLKMVSGPVFGRIVAKNDWCTSKLRKQFEEIRDLRFYALPGGVRLFDVAVTFRMTEKAVTFRDTKEGGLLSVRVASSMDVPAGGKIENAYGGINEGETWGKSSPWCDYSGEVGGTPVGIAIMDHESNPRYPTGWHVRNYGLMTANCFAWSHYRPEAKIKGDMAFKKGSKTTWRYRLYIHRGDARKGKVGERFIDYVAPPEVTAG